jgi:hypothetical protein
MAAAEDGGVLQHHVGLFLRFRVGGRLRACGLLRHLFGRIPESRRALAAARKAEALPGGDGFSSAAHGKRRGVQTTRRLGLTECSSLSRWQLPQPLKADFRSS